MKKATKWGAVKYLEFEKSVLAYLYAALEDGGTAVIVAAFGNMVCAKGMIPFAR